MSSLLAFVAWHLSRRRIVIYLCPNGYSRGYYPGAVRPHVDLLRECGKWLASVQTDKLARSSLLLLLLHGLAGQGVARQSSAHSYSRCC